MYNENDYGYRCGHHEEDKCKKEKEKDKCKKR